MSDNWILAAELADLPEDDVIGIDVNGHDIALYRTEDGVFASANLCSHGNARLSDGFLEAPCRKWLPPLLTRRGSACCAL